MEEVFEETLRAALAEQRDFGFSKQQVCDWIDEHGEDEIVEVFLRVLRRVDIPIIYPVTSQNSQKDIEKKVEYIRSHPCAVSTVTPWCFKINTATEFQHAPKGSLLLRPHPYLQALSSSLSGYERLTRRCRPSRISPSEKWTEDKNMRKGIRWCLGKTNLAQHRLRCFALQKTGYYTAFPISVACWIYNEISTRLDGKSIRVLDPCAGWSDRLAGAILCGPSVVASYHCVDPWDVSINVCKRTVGLLSPEEDQGRYIIQQGRAEDPTVEFPEVDLVFTSPPYGDLEVYGGEAVGDAAVQKEFVFSFLAPMIHKAALAVERRQGFVVINLANNTRIKTGEQPRLTEHLVEIARKEGLVLRETIGMTLSQRAYSATKDIRAEPIFVFQSGPQ